MGLSVAEESAHKALSKFGNGSEFDDLDVDDENAKEEGDDDDDASDGKGSTVGKKGKKKLKEKTGVKRGKYSKVRKDGQKPCTICKKWHSLEEYAQGANKCKPCHRAYSNVGTAAKAQGELVWWHGVKDDPEELQRVVKAYHHKCPRLEKKRNQKNAIQEKFRILQYNEERRRESQLLRDGVNEMMHLDAYIEHAAKKKYGGLTAFQARTKFMEVLMKAPGAVIDDEGPCETMSSRRCVSLSKKRI